MQVACVAALMLPALPSAAASRHVARGGVYPACPAGLTCNPVNASGFTFDCAFAGWSGKEATKGDVMHFHGNDDVNSKGMFAETMLQLASTGYRSVACDMRGYSPLAAPADPAAYNYDKLAADIFAVADAVGFHSFHVVAHDQGARVAWHSIAMSQGRKRFLSYATLSIPHADVFSDSLYGPNADPDQQAASQYVRVLVLNNSCSIDGNKLYDKLNNYHFPSPAALQKALWWYNGAIDAGNMALAPFGTMPSWLGFSEAEVRQLTQYPLTGVAQTVRVGNVSEFPVLYVCGGTDGSDLCKQAFGDESRKYIVPPAKFTYLPLAACGHDVLGCAQSKTVIDAIVSNIVNA